MHREMGNEAASRCDAMRAASASEAESLRREMREGGGWGGLSAEAGSLWKVSGRSTMSQKYASEMLGSLLVYVGGN